MTVVLSVYNAYLNRGGEDEVFDAEADLLEQHGNSVIRFRVEAGELKQPSLLKQAQLAANTIWSRSYARRFREMVRELRPDVVHFHNTFPLISPSVYGVCKQQGSAVVQTLHNYRLVCPNAIFFRDGHPCEDCLGRTPPWPGVLHACYHDSRPQTAVVSAMLTGHRLRKTWQRDVDTYVALTAFARQKFIQGGLPAEKIVIKPNFVDPDPGSGQGRGEYALFVGRLSPQKGIDTLLAAWDRLGEKVELKIVGDGPLAPKVEEAAKRSRKMEWLGRQPKEQVLAMMKDAQALLFPSVWYESFPVVIAEAYAAGLPVIASDLGGMSSLIDHGRTGLHFRPGDPEDLAAQVEWALVHPEELSSMRLEARAEYEAKYTAERNYEMLMEIYESAIEQRDPPRAVTSGTNR